MNQTNLRFTILAVTLTLLTATALRAQQQAVPENAIVINLDRTGSLRLNQEQIAFSNLVPRLHEITATPSDSTVVIVGAANVAFKELVKTLETVRLAGIDRVGILKSQPDGSIRESLPPLGATLLRVDRSGEVRLNGKKTKVRNISSQLQKVFKSRNDHTVYVQAYGALSFDTVSGIIDAAKAAGAKPIGLLASDE